MKNPFTPRNLFYGGVVLSQALSAGAGYLIARKARGREPTSLELIVGAVSKARDSVSDNEVASDRITMPVLTLLLAYTSFGYEAGRNVYHLTHD